MTHDPRVRVSLIATVLNERQSIDDWIGALERQTLIPDEIIVVDGGSVDGTFQVLEAWNPPCELHVIRAPGTTISAGRNVAIAQAKGDIVAVTDAGTQASPRWLQCLVEAFSIADVDVASGFFVPVIETSWDAALAATTLPDVGEINPRTFLPSSRSVGFRRRWFQIELAYPEWLDYCEDVVLDLALRRAGARFVFVPEAVVAYYGRATLCQFWTQYFNYARGDGKAGLFPVRHGIRYGMYVGLLITAIRHKPVELALVATLGMTYLWRPIRRLLARSPGGRRTSRYIWASIGLIPVVRFSGDAAKMVGYPVGIVWRLRRYGGLGPAFTWRRIHPRSGQRRP